MCLKKKKKSVFLRPTKRNRLLKHVSERESKNKLYLKTQNTKIIKMRVIKTGVKKKAGEKWSKKVRYEETKKP